MVNDNDRLEETSPVENTSGEGVFNSQADIVSNERVDKSDVVDERTEGKHHTEVATGLDLRLVKYRADELASRLEQLTRAGAGPVLTEDNFANLRAAANLASQLADMIPAQNWAD